MTRSQATETRVRRVLVVDDNVPFAENIAEIVADAAIGEAVIADSGPHALALVGAGTFDVMLTDMRMPGMSGAELIHRVRAIDVDLPIVITTAFTREDQLTDALSDGVLCVFAKPIAIATLLPAIARARRGMVVVVCDRGELAARSLAETLRERGIATVQVHSADEADALGRAGWVAMVDLRAGDGAAQGAMQHLAARFPGLPILPLQGPRTLATIEALCAERT